MNIQEAYEKKFYRCPKIAPIFLDAIEKGWGNMSWIEYRGTPRSTRGNSNAFQARSRVRPETILGEFVGSRAGRHLTEGYRCFIFFDSTVESFAEIFPDPYMVQEYLNSCKVS